MAYNPEPPRVWSRVQNQCSTNTDSSNLVYIPLTNQYVPPIIADYEKQLIAKGNILQYKKNSSNLTKNQRYSQIAKGMWTNRTKTWATQSQVYTNPNTASLKRVNYTEYPYPNNIVGAPNNISGPFEADLPNPFGCDTNILLDGGNLVCNTVVNPCSGEIIEQTSGQPCHPTTDSDVPGQVQLLCWNSKLETWYPRQRYFMSNSGTKWPQNYKALISALKPSPPTIISYSNTSNTVTINWNFIDNNCIPISSFNIYQNGVLIKNVPYTVTTFTTPTLVAGTYSYYIKALSNTTESLPSNTVTVYI